MSYAKISVEALISDSSGYVPADVKSDFADYEPGSATYKGGSLTVSAATGGTTVDLGSFGLTTILNVIVKNNDGTNYVAAAATTPTGSATLRCTAGNFVAFGGTLTVASDLVLTANTAACQCEVFVIGT